MASENEIGVGGTAPQALRKEAALMTPYDIPKMVLIDGKKEARNERRD